MNTTFEQSAQRFSGTLKSSWVEGEAVALQRVAVISVQDHQGSVVSFAVEAAAVAVVLEDSRCSLAASTGALAARGSSVSAVRVVVALVVGRVEVRHRDPADASVSGR